MSLKAKLSLGYLAILISSSLIVLWVEASNVSAGDSLRLPGDHFLLGSDILGRSLLMRALEGTRVSLGIGLVSTFGTFVIALAISFFALKSPRWLDHLVMRVVEVFMALPGIVVISLLLLFLNQLFPSSAPLVKIFNLSAALILTTWFSLARQLRTLLESERVKAYVESARALGASESRVFMHHILPNLSTPILVLLGLQVPNLILFESFLSFVGLGIQPPLASWGGLIQEGWRTLSTYPHLILVPSTVLFFTVLSFNVLFDEVRRSVLPGYKD